MPYMLPLPNMQAPPPSSKPQKHQQLMRTVSISILVMSLPVLYVSFLHIPPAALFRDTTFWFLMSNSIIIVIAADSGMLFFGSSSSSCSSVDVDNDGSASLPFVVFGGEPAAVKNDHVATGVSVSGDEVAVLPVENQVMVLREQEDVMMVAENDHAYALVLRDDQGQRMASSEPESRDIMAVRPSSDLAAGVAVPVWNEGGAMARANRTGLIQMKASRSLAREERLRRRQSHRASHSRALVPVQDKSVVVTEEKQLCHTATTTEGPRPSAAEEKEKESEYSRLSDEELNLRVEEFITKFNREIRLQLEREQLALAAA